MKRAQVPSLLSRLVALIKVLRGALRAPQNKSWAAPCFRQSKDSRVPELAGASTLSEGGLWLLVLVVLTTVAQRTDGYCYSGAGCPAPPGTLIFRAVQALG